MDYVKVLSDLVAINTTVPPGQNYESVMDYLEPLFRGAGCTTEKVLIPWEHSDGNPPRTNLLAHRRQPGQPRLVFYAHIDVVPAEGWDAFTPRVAGGKLYGRGAADMKGSLAALCLALEMVKDRPLKYDISVMVTTDEEVGQADQLRYLGKRLAPLAGAYLFDLDSSFGYVTIASLGALHLDIKVKGKSVHSAMAHLGRNAVEDSVRLLDALLDLKKKVIQRQSQVATNPDSGITRMQARLNINMVHGGLKVNIVPDECLIAIDRRLIPEENIAEAERELMTVLRSVPGVDWEVARIFRIPTVPPAAAPIIDELAGIIKRVTGQTGKYGEMGSGDFAPVTARDWQAIHFGSGVIRPECSIHGRDEFVYLKDVESLATVITQFIGG